MTTNNGYKMYIGGEWVSHNGTFADYNPATGDVWATIPNGTKEDATAAIEAAVAAQAEWAALPHTERAKVMSKAADVLERRCRSIGSCSTPPCGSERQGPRG